MNDSNLELLNNLNNEKSFRKIVERKRTLFCSFSDNFYEKDIFFELLYCLLTIQNSFVRAKSAMSYLKENFVFEELFIQMGDDLFLKNVKKSLIKFSIRFYNNKAQYFLNAKKLFWSSGSKSFELLRDKNVNIFDKRLWLKNNVKGFGMKEATHFLRNIGIGFELGILDRHVLRSLNSFNVLKTIPASLSEKKYLEIEKELIAFAKKNDIDMFDLDFLLFIFGKTKNLIMDENTAIILNELK